MVFRVLIAIDGSDHAHQAFQWYLDHTHKPNHQVILAHVASLPLHPAFAYKAGLAVPREQWQAMIHDEQKKVDAMKQSYIDALRERGIQYKFRVEEGDAGSCICNMTKETDADMVVMGTRGQGTISRTILGSVSDYVLHHSNVPVAICHRKESFP